MSKVRVRFAPSPTGLPHLGNIRTALFNWLFAKHHNGEFILRFEDTDRERLVPESVDYIQQSLQWLGLEWNEGPEAGGAHQPYIQSQRLEIYRQHADMLLKDSRMYPCWCSPQRLEELRKQAETEKRAYKYDRHCLESPGDNTKPHVLRFKIDADYNPRWKDMVRGALSQKGSELDDFVCIKSDGYPTYNFANVVDDHLMEISHVIRGDEFIASTPKFLQVYKAFGWEPPLFAHLPQVLGPDKAKLSKRHGAEPVLNYQSEGYLPEAIINFLAHLGWNDGTTKELYTQKELINAFSLERIQKSPAVFDEERLGWFNAHYLRQLSAEELLNISRKFWPEAAKSIDDTFKKRMLQIMRERLRFLGELPELSKIFVTWRAFDKEELGKLAADFSKQTGGLELADWLTKMAKLAGQNGKDMETLQKDLKQLVSSQTGNAKPYWESLRVILCSGAKHTPPIWEIIYVLGPDESTRRLERTLKLL